MEEKTLGLNFLVQGVFNVLGIFKRKKKPRNELTGNGLLQRGSRLQLVKPK